MPGFGYSSYASIPTILTVLGIIGLIGGIVLLFTFLPAKNAGRFRGFAKWLYDFLNFNRLWATSLLKVIFIAAFFVGLLGGFIILFIIPAYGLTLIAASVVVRIAYELIIVILKINENLATTTRNTARIADKVAGPDILFDQSFSAPPMPNGAPPMTASVPPMPNGAPPEAAPIPQAPACPFCGAPTAADKAFCHNCGGKLKDQ